MTVAVIDPKTSVEIEFNDRDFKVQWYSGTGAGGQHRNKHQNSCRITHLESGIVSTAQCRARENSLQEAKTCILQKLNSQASGAAHDTLSKDRRSQMGSGMRGDKIRTYRFQDNSVKDHRTEKTSQADKVLAGNIDLLW